MSASRHEVMGERLSMSAPLGCLVIGCVGAALSTSLVAQAMTPPPPPPPVVQQVAPPPPPAPPPVEVKRPVDCPPQLEVHFAVGTKVPPPEIRPELEKLAAWSKEHPEARFVLDGHADGSGDNAKNLELSHARAVAVQDVLASLGVDRTKTTPRAFGAYQPLVGAESDDAQQRRVRVSVAGAPGECENRTGVNP